MSLTAVNVLYEVYGQISSPLFCGAYTKIEHGEKLRLVAGHRITQERIGTARKVSSKQERVLTRDWGVLGELAHNFADFRGDKCITRKR